MASLSLCVYNETYDCITINVTGFIVASQTTDIFYLLRRIGKDAQSAKDIVKKLTNNIKVLNITATDVQNALASDMPDYEDTLFVCCDNRQKAEYIITRNEKDFKLSQIPALPPQVFLERFFLL